MRVRHMVLSIFAVIFIMLGIHILVSIAPTNKEYVEAVESFNLVKEEGFVTQGIVVVNYDYTDEPNMGSQYAADVMYADGQAAWVALHKPIGAGKQIEIKIHPDVPNFAINMLHPTLPHEKMNTSAAFFGKIFIFLGLLYFVAEALVYMIRSLIGKKPYVPKHSTGKWHKDDHKPPSIWVVVVLAVMSIINVYSTWTSYDEVTERIESVRSQNKVIFAELDERCMDRPENEECMGRYNAFYSTATDGNFSRLFHVKGKIIDDEAMREFDDAHMYSKIPLLYNQDDPRFAYALSSSERVAKEVSRGYDTGRPYNEIAFFSGPVFLTIAISRFFLERREKKLSKIT